MIQEVMFFALGLLTAGLLAVLVTPAIWRRAMRLTRQRIERSVPMTLAEIEADKDHLRAEFAMSTRRLEMSTERLREKTTEQVIEINKKRSEIVRLSNEVGDQAEAIETLEAKLASLDTEYTSTIEDLRVARQLIARQEADLAERAARIGRLESLLDSADQLTAEQKLELAANATSIANLSDELGDTSATLATVTAERDRLAASLIAEQSALAAERRRTVNLEASLARIEAERAGRVVELRAASGAEPDRPRPPAQGLAARIVELQTARRQNPPETAAAPADDTAAFARLAALQVEHNRLRAELDGRIEEIAALKTELASVGMLTDAPPLAPAEQPDGDNVAKAIAAAEAERAELLARLNIAEATAQALADENAELRQLGGDREIVRENALLRDRLAQIAADVVRLDDGAGEAGTAAAPAAANGGNGHAGHEEPPQPVLLHGAPIAPAMADEAVPAEVKPLAERLRALQHTAARH